MHFLAPCMVAHSVAAQQCSRGVCVSLGTPIETASDCLVFHMLRTNSSISKLALFESKAAGAITSLLLLLQRRFCNEETHDLHTHTNIHNGTLHYSCFFLRKLRLEQCHLLFRSPSLPHSAFSSRPSQSYSTLPSLLLTLNLTLFFLLFSC